MRELTNEEMLQAENKISRMSRHFLNPEQRNVFDRYRELYKISKERYRKDFDYRVKFYFGLLIITSILLSMGLVSLLVYLTIKINEI